jgi:hypothetical protein
MHHAEVPLELAERQPLRARVREWLLHRERLVDELLVGVEQRDRDAVPRQRAQREDRLEPGHAAARDHHVERLLVHRTAALHPAGNYGFVARQTADGPAPARGDDRRMTDRYIPAVDQLGPDPEPLPPRFGRLLAAHLEASRRTSRRRPKLDAVQGERDPRVSPPALAA